MQANISFTERRVSFYMHMCFPMVTAAGCPLPAKWATPPSDYIVVFYVWRADWCEYAGNITLRRAPASNCLG